MHAPGEPPSLQTSPVAGRSGPAATGVALLFPGQGSQTPDMRATAAEARPDLLEAAIEECGGDPFDRIDEGTAFAQPALFVASIAAWEQAGRPEASMMVGHSLGEIAALTAAGSISAEAGLRIAAERGRLMDRAAKVGPPGGMLAVIGHEPEANLIARELNLTIANHNSIGQLVLSGSVEDLESARKLAGERKLKAMRLPVAGAFHSPAMQCAVPPFIDLLETVDFDEPSVPVYSSTTARPFTYIRATLAEGLVKRVRWTEAVHAMHEAGATSFVEVGPGRVLSRLVRRTLPGVTATTLVADRG